MPDPNDRRDRIGAVAEKSIVVAIVASAGLFVTALVAFAWGMAKVWSFVRLLLDDGADSSLAIVRLLEVIDVFLLGVVLLIIAIGVIELFVTSLRLPAWLVIDSLTDLKGKIIDVIQLVAAIKFLEKLVKADDPLDTLWYALAVSAVILALLAVRWVQKNDSH